MYLVKYFNVNFFSCYQQMYYSQKTVLVSLIKNLEVYIIIFPKFMGIVVIFPIYDFPKSFGKELVIDHEKDAV